MSNARSFLWPVFIIGMFFLSIWSSATFLTGVYQDSAAMRVSIPSLEMLYVVVFLFWFVLFLIPSWDD